MARRKSSAPVFDYNNTSAWYAIHTKSGREEAVKARIEALEKSRGLDQFVDELFIAYETIEEVRNNKVVEKKKKIYPTYLFGKIKMTDDVWYVIRNTQDVYGFIGSAGKHGKPTPFKDIDIDDLKRRCGVPIQVNLDFVEGDEVIILDGLFKGHTGKVGSIGDDTAVVITQVFNRDTPIDVELYNLQRYVNVDN